MNNINEKFNRLITETIDPSVISQGDLVDFGTYGKLYVAQTGTDTFWVTEQKENRFDDNASGWSIDARFAKQILEHASDLQEDCGCQHDTEEEPEEVVLALGDINEALSDLFGDEDEDDTAQRSDKQRGPLNPEEPKAAEDWWDNLDSDEQAKYEQNEDSNGSQDAMHKAIEDSRANIYRDGKPDLGEVYYIIRSGAVDGHWSHEDAKSFLDKNFPKEGMSEDGGGVMLYKTAVPANRRNMFDKVDESGFGHTAAGGELGLIDYSATVDYDHEDEVEEGLANNGLNSDPGHTSKQIAGPLEPGTGSVRDQNMDYVLDRQGDVEGRQKEYDSFDIGDRSDDELQAIADEIREHLGEGLAEDHLHTSDEKISFILTKQKSALMPKGWKSRAELEALESDALDKIYGMIEYALQINDRSLSSPRLATTLNDSLNELTEAEHHLQSREEQEEFILQHMADSSTHGYQPNQEELSSFSDERVETIYKKVDFKKRSKDSVSESTVRGYLKLIENYPIEGQSVNVYYDSKKKTIIESIEQPSGLVEVKTYAPNQFDSRKYGLGQTHYAALLAENKGKWEDIDETTTTASMAVGDMSAFGTKYDELEEGRGELEEAEGDIAYRNYHMHKDTYSRGENWIFTHDEYDGAPDAGISRKLIGHANSVEQAEQLIDAQIEDFDLVELGLSEAEGDDWTDPNLDKSGKNVMKRTAKQGHFPKPKGRDDDEATKGQRKGAGDYGYGAGAGFKGGDGGDMGGGFGEDEEEKDLNQALQEVVSTHTLGAPDRRMGSDDDDLGIDRVESRKSTMRDRWDMQTGVEKYLADKKQNKK